MIRPGEVYRAEFTDAGWHPIIVVSRESLNRGNSVLAVLCTSAGFARRSRLPNCVPFRAGEFGFTVDCVAQCEQLGIILHDQIDLDGGPIGVLDEATMRGVIKAIGYVVESDCEPE